MYVYILIVLFHVEHTTARISGSRSIRTIALARTSELCLKEKKRYTLNRTFSSEIMVLIVIVIVYVVVAVFVVPLSKNRRNECVIENEAIANEPENFFPS